MRNWAAHVRVWSKLLPAKDGPVIALALGGGFARAIAHLGVLRVFEEQRIPIDMIAGVSAGSIIAAAYASGTAIEQIARMACAMKFKDVARWTISAMGLAGSERMEPFLRRLLRAYRFEDMRTPLAVVATDLNTGNAVVFKDHGEVFMPVRASCSYPGLFQPVKHNGHYLIDGAMAMEVPAAALREMGATEVVSVSLPVQSAAFDPRNMLQVINRSFQILQKRTENDWRRHSSLVIEPDVRGMPWDCFDSAERLIENGAKAARAALPVVLGWVKSRKKAAAPRPAPSGGLVVQRSAP